MIKRITEIDFFRGLFLSLMIIYHLCYDLYNTYNLNIPYDNIILNNMRIIISCGFILICGISSTLSKNNLKRGIILFLIALGITLVTYLYDNTYYIKFGIIHFLSIAIIFYHFISNLNYKNLFIILAIFILITCLIQFININNPYLAILGINSYSFSSLDYFPIFGNINIFIIGNIIGKALYKNKENIMYDFKNNNFFVLLGQKSLVIYIIHQPIILLILKIIYKY